MRADLALPCLAEIPTFSLARLPKSFVELYSIVNKVKGRDETTLMDDADDAGSAETAICLVSGAVLRSGSTRRSFSRAVSKQSCGQTVFYYIRLSQRKTAPLLAVPTTWCLYPSCPQEWLWDRHIFLGSEVHSALDAQ